jgi:hypothetical protein
MTEHGGCRPYTQIRLGLIVLPLALLLFNPVLLMALCGLSALWACYFGAWMAIRDGRPTWTPYPLQWQWYAPAQDDSLPAIAKSRPKRTALASTERVTNRVTASGLRSGLPLSPVPHRT